MIGLLIAIHAVICLLLIGIILIQAGRGGGLVEGFSGMESMFGTKTNSFLARSTTVLSIMFFITCLTLALLSARQSRSLMKDLRQPQKDAVVPETAKQDQAAGVPKTE